MKKLIFASVAVAVAGAVALSSCSKKSGWSVEGEVAGLSSTPLVVEGFNNGLWYVIDSVSTDKGQFKYQAEEAVAYPEIMRLGLGGKYIYFPIDSIDNISIYTDSANFDTKYQLGGNLQARTIQSLDSVLNASIAERGAALTLADKALKHGLFTIAYEDPSILSVYYLINKTVDGKPLYDMANAADLRLYGAVAQRFANERPDDPRGEYMSAAYRKARGAGNATQLEATEVSIIDIERADYKGEKHSLADVASKGNVVVLSFTAYGMENSPAYTAILNSVYDKYHKNGLEIYQIAFDEDETTWKQTARNLPWIAVWNSTTDSKQPLIDYNVGALPMTYVIDRQGNLVARVTDPNDIEKEVGKRM